MLSSQVVSVRGFGMFMMTLVSLAGIFELLRQLPHVHQVFNNIVGSFLMIDKAKSVSESGRVFFNVMVFCVCSGEFILNE